VWSYISTPTYTFMAFTGSVSLLFVQGLTIYPHVPVCVVGSASLVVSTGKAISGQPPSSPHFAAYFSLAATAIHSQSTEQTGCVQDQP